MTNSQTSELLADGHTTEQVLAFHLTSRHFPPVHLDFIPVCLRAIELADDGSWDSTLLLPNGRVLTVAAIVEGLHLDPFLDTGDAWQELD